MTDKFEGLTTFIVAGGGRWGRGNDLAEAKRNFTRFGGRLTGGYEVIEFGPDTTFTGVDEIGRYYFDGPPPATREVPPSRPRRPTSSRPVTR